MAKAGRKYHPNAARVEPRSLMTAEEFVSLLEAAEGDLRLEVEFAGTTGLRAVEQFGLMWRDVDLENRIVTVRQDTKIESHRFVPLSSAMAEKLRLKIVGLDSSSQELVFSNRHGQGRASHQIYLDFSDLRARAAALRPGVPGLISKVWHDLRRFACISWREAKIPNWALFAGLGESPWIKSPYRPVMPTQADFDIIDLIADSYPSG